MRRLAVLAFALLVTLVIAPGPASAQQPRVPPAGAPPAGSGPFEITGPIRVVDGDTIDLLITNAQVLVGLIGADAPAGNTACGREAAALLRTLVRGGVRLEEDPAVTFDARNRRMYEVFTGDGRSIASALVTAGVARADGAGREGAQLAAAEVAARSAGRGCLWRDPTASLPTPAPAAPEPAAAPAITATALPGDFTQETVAGGLTRPVSFVFLPDGGVLIAEQSGIVRLFRDGTLRPAPVIDIRDRVNEYLDRGLLGLAADPNFAVNGFIYLLYTFEDNADEYDGTKTARLARYTVTGETASPASELVLLGTVTGRSCNIFARGTDCIPSDSPSHSVGNVRFAPDGTLFVTTGDGAHYNIVDDDALRAQDLDLLAGKLLRITATGEGLPDNPFWNGDAGANRSKVWSYGLRNPYRFSLRPETGRLYIGDVGWDEWEEISVAAAGANLGWPCYEGESRQPGYQPRGVCPALYSGGAAAVQRPLTTWAHTGGSFAATGGAFYTGTVYPAEYQGAYFYGDYGQNFIRALRVNPDDTLVPGSDTAFATGADGPVDIQTGPDQQLYYLSIIAGELRRIRYTGLAPPEGTSFLSDLTPRGESNGWGPVERDQSNGDLFAGDGLPLTLDGRTFAKGLGVHAVSELRYYLGGTCTGFSAEAGVDDEVGDLGTVVFDVLADGVLLFSSGVMTGTTPARTVSVGLAGRAELRLLVSDAGDGIDYDHADWAGARLTCGATGPPVVSSVSPAPDATGVFLTSLVTVTFSASIDPATVTGATVTLVRDGMGTPVPATLGYDDATRTVTLAPTGGLEPGSRYTATVRGGPGGVRTPTGDALDGDTVWSFATTTDRPPVATISAPTPSLRFGVGDLVAFSGFATDAEDGAIPPDRLSWSVVLFHCPGFGPECHTHQFLTRGGSGGGFTVPDHGDGYRFEITLTATDSGGQSAGASVAIEPRTVQVTLETAPAPLQVVYTGEGGTAPLTRTAVAGSTITVFALSPQGEYTFLSWSDGGAQQHNVTVGETDMRYTATFAAGAPPGETRFLSDLAWSGAESGWGPVERDQSNGDFFAGDGGPLTLGGRTFAKGLGLHAPADLRYPLGGGCTTFTATAGVDEEVGGNGSVVFQVWTDGVRLYDSGVVTGGGAARAVSVSLAGRAELQLIVTDAGDGIDYDHADWADARISCG